MFEGMKPENLNVAQKKAVNVRTKRQFVVNFRFVNTIKPNTFRDISFTNFVLSDSVIISNSVLEKKNMFLRE